MSRLILTPEQLEKEQHMLQEFQTRKIEQITKTIKHLENYINKELFRIYNHIAVEIKLHLVDKIFSATEIEALIKELPPQEKKDKIKQNHRIKKINATINYKKEIIDMILDRVQLNDTLPDKQQIKKRGRPLNNTSPDKQQINQKEFKPKKKRGRPPKIFILSDRSNISPYDGIEDDEDIEGVS